MLGRFGLGAGAFLGFALCGGFGFALCGCFGLEAGSLFGFALCGCFGLGAGSLFRFALCGCFGLEAGALLGFALCDGFGLGAGALGCFGLGAGALRGLAQGGGLGFAFCGRFGLALCGCFGFACGRVSSASAPARSAVSASRAGALGGFGAPRGRAPPLRAVCVARLCGFGAGALLRLAARDLRVESCRLGDLELGRLERLGRRFRDDRERGAGERQGLVLEQTELVAPHLSARCLRKLLQEGDHSRVLVRCRHRLDVLLELADEPRARLVPGAEDNERLDDLAPFGVRYAHDGALGNRGMLEEGALDLEGADPVRRGDDDVVRASDEPQVSVLVSRRPVARQVPPVPEAPRRSRPGRSSSR